MPNKAQSVYFTPHGFIPTQEQQNIQRSQHRVTLVEANAGAAKTTTLALRVGEAIARGLPPQKILALVFTPEAREVMKARLVEIGIPASTVTQIPVRTFEEFSAQVLKTLEGGPVLQLNSAKDLKPYALDAIERVSQNHLDNSGFLDIRTHNIAVSQFLGHQLRLKAKMQLQENDLDMGPEETAEYLGIPYSDYLWVREYEHLRLGSFDEVRFRGPFDATYDLACQLTQFPETSYALPDYRLVVGDELHDLNEAEFCILQALLNKPNLYFVGAGDKDQVIHSDLGADAAYLQSRFTAIYPATARYPLTMTYRHGPHLAYAMEAFKQKPVDSTLPVSTEIAQRHYDHTDQNDAAARVVDAIKQWKAEKLPLEACAILLRERHQSVAIENALMQAKIPYKTQGMQGYLQREEILFLRGLMAIALKNLASIKSPAIQKAIIEALAIFGELTLSPKEMDEAKSIIAQDPSILNTFFSGHILRHKHDQAKIKISQAIAYIQNIASDQPAHTILREVCQQMDLEAVAKRIYVHPHDAAVITKSVDGFITVAEQSGMNLLEFSEWTGAADALVASRKSKGLVMLECVANSKGMEFDHVILPLLENGEFPSAMNPSLLEEENLFYVGATRAKLRLTLISPQNEQKRSPFIQRMALASSRGRAQAAVLNNQTQASTTVAPTRVDLKVAYADKDRAKALGAQWDAARKVWYVKPELDPEPFRHWFIKS